MTLFGAFLVVAACAYAGEAMARQKRRELLQTEGCHALVAHILRRLTSLQLMGDILADFHDDALEKAGVLARLSEKPCNKSFAFAIELLKEDTPLYKILAAVAADLGGTELERQQQSLIPAEKELSLLAQARRQALSDTERCYRRLGLLGGAAVAILLL